jgi:hypothetical protein
LRRRTVAEVIKHVGDLAHKRAHSSHWRWAKFELSARLKGHISFGPYPPRARHDLLKFINGDWLWAAACEAHGEDLEFDARLWRYVNGSWIEQPSNEPSERRMCMAHDRPPSSSNIAYLSSR